MEKNIVLIGLMGSGKSTIGKKLAEKTDKTFIDTDEEIVKKTGKAISEIFEINGESYFRDIETEVVKEISLLSNCIISTGGGVVLKQENIDNLKENGILFFLDAPAETIWERIKNDTSRPILKGENPLQILKNVLKKRKPLYEQADFTINAENCIKQTVEEITKLYKK